MFQNLVGRKKGKHERDPFKICIVTGASGIYASDAKRTHTNIDFEHCPTYSFI